MEKVRVLFVGFDSKHIPNPVEEEEFEHTQANKRQGIPTIYDHNILFLNTAGFGLREYESLNKKANEIGTFLSTGGVLITELCPKEELKKKLDNYSWLRLPAHIRIANNHGKKITANSSHWLGQALKKHEAELAWKAHLGTKTIPSQTIAENGAGFPVSFELACGAGRTIFLPHYSGSRMPAYLRDVLEKVKENAIAKTSAGAPVPGWVYDCMLPGERKAREEQQKIEAKIQEFDRIRQVLYEHGLPLADAVKNLLEKMGFAANATESTGQHWLELSTEGFRGIAEVKGHKRQATADDLRQLLHQHIDKETEAGEAKGIFIVNHFCNKAPYEREEAYTQDAVDIGKKYRFCLLTTYDLFALYCAFCEGKLKKEKAAKLLQETDGPLK